MFYKEPNKAAGSLRLDKAMVEWSLSIDKADLPKESKGSYRLITIDDEQLRFDDVFSSLHTDVYKKILEGKGFGLEDARPSIECVHKIRRFK